MNKETPRPVVAHIIPEYLIAAQSYIYRQLFDHQEVQILPVTKLCVRGSRQLFPISNLQALLNRGSVYGFLNKIDERIVDTIFKYYLWLLIKIKKIELLHVHFGTEGAKLSQFRKFFDVPLVVYFYGSDTTASPLKPKWQKLYKEMYESADILLTLAEGPRQQLISLGAPIEKIKIVHLSADLKNLPFAKRDFTKPPTFLILARLIEKKGHLVLLKAFKELIRSGYKAKLNIGGYGELDTVIEQTIRENNLGDYVNFVNTAGVVDQFSVFKDLLYKSSIFVLPSIIASDNDSEGTPITLMEASATGLPIISTRVAGIPEVVLDHKTGLLVEQRDVAGLAQAMRELGSSPELCEQYAQAGRKHIEENFSTESLIKNLDKIYLELLNKK